jgi:Tol biopolymer transport system component
MKLIGCLVLSAAIALGQSPAELQLKAATHKQEVEGDLKGAMEAYRQIIARSGKERGVVAQAMLRLAQCHEKLGQAEARKLYEQIASGYSDQTAVAAEARQRLAALSVGASGRTELAARRLWTGDGVGGTVPFEVSPAPDGRSVLFAHWDTGDAAVRDLGSGEIKRLGLKKSWADSNDFVEDLVYSPDQRQFAYAWYDGTRYYLRVASTQPGAKPRVLIDDPKLAFLQPFAWSPDGKSILTQIWKVRGEADYTQIVWVSAADGSVKTVKSVDSRTPQMISLSPDGGYIAFDALEQQGSVDRDIFLIRADGSSETAAVQSPGIDKDPVWTPDGSHLVFTSSRSRNFGLYALRVDGGKPQGAPKLLKADIGSITLRGFARGTLYYLHPNGEQNAFRAELDLQNGKLRGTPAALGSTYLANNGMAALSPDGKRVAYLATSASGETPSLIGGSAAGGSPSVVVKSLGGGAERTYPTNLALSWAPMWLPDGKALLISGRRGRGGIGQAFYRLDLDSGQITRLLENTVNWQQPGAARGQRDLTRDGKTVYLSVNNWGPAGALTPGGGVAAVSLASGETRRIYEAEGRIQAQAVSLSPDNRRLAVTTRNVGKPGSTLLVMGADGSSPRVVFESTDLAAVAGVAWSSDGKDILFVRSVPGSDSQLWRISAAGGEPSATGIHGRRLREIQSGPNGAITFTSGSPKQAELWAMDNLLPIVKSSQ